MPDAFVRPARVADAGVVAHLQLSTWRTAYAGMVPDAVLAGIEPGGLASAWHAAITDPPTPRHRVLVAQEGDEPVGFAAFGPAEPDDLATAPGSGHAALPPDPDRTMTVGPLLVEPRWGRRGHGSRLLAAVVDLARADGFTAAVTWVLDADHSSVAFFTSAGWEPDGTGRLLDMAGTEVPEARLVTTLDQG